MKTDKDNTRERFAEKGFSSTGFACISECNVDKKFVILVSFSVSTIVMLITKLIFG